MNKIEEKELKKIFEKGNFYNIEIVGIHYKKKTLTLRVVTDKYKPGLKKVTPKPIVKMWSLREDKEFYKDFKLKILIYEKEKFIKEFEHYNWLYQAIVAADNNTILKIKKILEDHNFAIDISNAGFDKKLKHINIFYKVKKKN